MPPQLAIRTFVVLAFAYFLSTLIRAITATLAPTLVAELQLSAADLGLLAGGYFLGFSCTQLPLGSWLDKHGPRRVESLFLAVAVVGCLAFAWASSFSGLLIARVLSGIGLSACLMAPLTGYRRWYAPATLMRANAWMLMVGALGAVASTLPVQWLVPLLGWRPLFVMLALALVLALLLILWLLPAWEVGGAQDGPGGQTAAPTADAAPAGYAEVWQNRYFQRLIPLALLGYGGMVAMQTLWVTPWMIHVAGYTPVEAANGLFWISVAMLLTYWLWGWANPWLVARGIGANPLLRYGVPLSVAVVAMTALLGARAGAATPWLLGAFCVLATVNSVAQPAVGMVFRPALAGRALTAYNLVVFCGVFAVQWGLGIAIDALRAQGWAEVAAYQGAWALYGLAYLAAYLVFVLPKRP